jgi:hypothetical protein
MIDLQNQYSWYSGSREGHYYIRNKDGKVLGHVWMYPNHSFLVNSKIYEDVFPLTDRNEKYIGHYCNVEYAKLSVERYWMMQSRTLLEDE